MPFTEANVETAMCLWEAALEMRDAHPALNAKWEEEGTVALRHTIIGLVDQCEAEWNADCAKDEGNMPYDWEHCPAFLARWIATLV